VLTFLTADSAFRAKRMRTLSLKRLTQAIRTIERTTLASCSMIDCMSMNWLIALAGGFLWVESW
jgi:hypothetical protein